MNPSKPKFVYFDLGNVLMHFDHEIACQQLGKLVNRDPERIRQIVFESDLQHRYETGDVTTSEFLRAFDEQLGITSDAAEVLHAASAIFEPNYQVVPVVTQLRRAGIPVGILSNTCEAHWDYIHGGRYRFIDDLFQVYALSFELKTAKPDLEIYEQAAAMASADPAQIFFVDDRPENVEGALAAGFDAVQFRTSTELIQALMARDLLAYI